MMLYVNGSDIARVVLGVLNDDRSAFLVDPVTFSASPEQFLATVDEFLSLHVDAGHGSPAYDVRASNLTGLVAVLGPGSATALRTSLTIVNTLAFAQSLPIFGVELDPDANDRAALVYLRGVSSMPMARPLYANSAKITVSTKDALGRR